MVGTPSTVGGVVGMPVLTPVNVGAGNLGYQFVGQSAGLPAQTILLAVPANQQIVI